MGLWAYMKTMFFFHMILGYIFIIGGLIVCFLMLLTYIFVWPWDQTLYRKICYNLAYAHWSQFVFVAQWWSGSDTTLILENPDDRKYIGKEHHIVVANHKYDIDWLALWILAERLEMLGGTKIYGKSILRWVPIIGWAWMFTESIFLKREWDKDKEIIKRDLAYLTDYPPGYWVTLLLFPEGTRFTAEKHQESMEVAKKKGRTVLKHHLLPRTKGFTQSMRGIKGKMHSVLDLTVGFYDEGYTPSVLNVIQGRSFKAELYCRRIPLEDIPTDSDEECGEWLHKLFEEKDKIFDEFDKNGSFLGGDLEGSIVPIKKRPHDLLTYILWCLTLLVPMLKYLLSVILYGSLTLKIGVVTVIVIASIGVRQMIAVSETHKGSSYGKTGKQVTKIVEDLDKKVDEVAETVDKKVGELVNNNAPAADKKEN